MTPHVDLKLLYETISHCAEPADEDEILAGLGVDTGYASKGSLAKKEKEAAEKEHADGSYRVKFNSGNFPERHPTWPEAFQLHIDEKNEFFYVLQSEGDKPDEDEDVHQTDFLPDDSQTRVGDFGYRYECGSKARDKHGNFIDKVNDQIEFNYAEHKMIGEKLELKWPKGESFETRRGDKPLTLNNKVKLSYGEINALGGDFFGGYHPVSDGKNLDEQGKYFKEAFATLADNSRATTKVADLVKNRAEEVKEIAKAVETIEKELKEGKKPTVSTFDVYKRLNQPVIFGIDKADLDAQIKTTFTTASGPSYLRLSQINFDHFGKDAVTAYNAGHYEALKEAAGGTLENLERAYAMNAFADHYLGDSFASGHFRTPRRALHGSDTILGAAWAAVTGAVQTTFAGDGFLRGLTKAAAPDLLSMVSISHLSFHISRSL